jgi:hypothetical protein
VLTVNILFSAYNSDCVCIYIGGALGVFVFSECYKINKFQKEHLYYIILIEVFL